jgi:hypothetical protein
MLKGTTKKVVQKVLIIVGGFSFLWATFAGVGKMFTEPQAGNSNPTQTEVKSPEQQLQEQAKGYESVLKKEPNNRFALEKLVEISLKLKDAKGAYEPLKKLVELYPDDPRYKEVLAIVEKQIAAENNPNNDQQNPEQNPENTPQTPSQP